MRGLHDTLTAGTNITIENNVISSTAQESFFRGNWNYWSSVPSDVNLYPADYKGNKTPTYSDFLIVKNASDYASEFIESIEIEHGDLWNYVNVTINGVTTKVDIVEGDNYFFNNMFYIRTEGNVFEASLYSNYITKFGNTVYPVGTKIFTYPAREGVTVRKVYYQAPLSGTWRFSYYGTWNEDGKNGWKPEYQVEDVLPIASPTEQGIAKLYNTTGQNTDGAVDQATVTNALGGKQDTLTAGTNITIENNIISSVAQESFFRGRWANWSNVPTNDSLYPEDYHGNHTPMENDYMVVEDTSDYTDDFPIDVSISTYGSGGWETFFYFTMGGETKDIRSGTVTFSNGVVVTVIESSWGGRIIQINRNFKIGSTIYPKDTDYDLKGSVTSMKIASETPTIYSGVWRFAYHGVWATNGRDGWKPEYQVEDVLPVATDTVAGITKLYTTTGSNTDGTMDQNSITTALDAKQDLLDEFTAHEVEALWESIHA